MKDIKNLKYAVTHGSIFHSDDVFATALLLTLNPGLQIERVNSIDMAKHADGDDCIVYDIGLGEYDHHQPDAAVRPLEDGYWFDKEGKMSQIKYCSLGLLWRDYGRLLCPDVTAWKKVDRDLILAIDKADNGVARSDIANFVSQFNPNWNEDDSPAHRDALFMQAVLIAKIILGKYVASANAVAEAADAINSHASVIDGNILVLDRYIPWQDVVVESMPEILYVVFPSSRGGYNVQTVPETPGSFKGRKLFPREWLGHPDASLGMTFCHPGNFILATETLDQAINCARIAAQK